MVVLDIEVGQRVSIGEGVFITLKRKSGRHARLAFHADASVKIRLEPAAGDHPAAEPLAEY